MKCSRCQRDAGVDHEGVLLCCEGCAKYGVHSAACNKRAYPEWRAAQYVDDTDAANKIVERLQKALAITHVLNTELQEITSAARNFIPGYSGSAVELMINHLHLDISYAESAARKMLGS